MTPADLIIVSSTIALLVLIAALIMTTARVMLGPSLADRVLALDMLVAVAIGFIAVISIRTGHFLYVDIALALGLVGFLATVAFARFIWSGAEGPPAAWPRVDPPQLPGRHRNRKQAAVPPRSTTREKPRQRKGRRR